MDVLAQHILGSAALNEWECSVMRTRTPPLAPTDDVTIHIVLNDFGEKLGRAFIETDEAEADEWTIVSNIISGEYSNPVRVVAFNIAEGWSRDVTDDIAQAVIERGRSENNFSKVAKDRVRDTRGRPINAPAAFIHPCRPIVVAVGRSNVGKGRLEEC